VVGDGAALRPLEAEQEVGGRVAEPFEGGAHEIEVGRPRLRCAARERCALVGALRQPLVDDDRPQVGAVDVHLGLGDADRQEGGDVLVGDLVEVALEGDAAGGVAQAIDHARGVVGPARQRREVRRLSGEALGDRPPVAADDPPVRDLVPKQSGRAFGPARASRPSAPSASTDARSRRRFCSAIFEPVCARLIRSGAY
jgi:hypothetical protein